MNRVGIRELRQNLSVYLRRVRREALEVTEPGRPVAVLRPLRDPADPFVRLEERGLVLRRGAVNLADLPRPTKAELARPLDVVLDELRKDRI